MTYDEMKGEPVADPEIRGALRVVSGDPPLAAVDWDALRSSIRARAALPLARRRSADRQGGMRRLRPLIPLAAAASVALAVWLGGSRLAQGERASHAGSTPDAAALEEALRLDVSEQEFRLLVSGRADPEALLLIAVGDG